MFLLMVPTDHIPSSAHGPLDYGEFGMVILRQCLVDIATVVLPGLHKHLHNHPSLDVRFLLTMITVRSVCAHKEFYVKPCNLKWLVQ